MFTFERGKFIKGKFINTDESPPNVSSDITDTKFIHGVSTCQFKDDVFNSLECIAILVTSHEINKGFLSNFLNNIKNTTPKNNTILNIFTNNSNHDPILLDDVKDIFKSIDITDLDISPDADMYIKFPYTLPKIPQFGYSSGPNILFMKAMSFCNKYNTTLVLETDCKLYIGWFEKCKAYVSSEYFMISGSTYDGSNLIPTTDRAMFCHLNGVAFYKTGSPILQFVFSELSRFIIHRVLEQGKPHSSYDICLIDLILTGCDEGSETSRKFWRNIMRYIFKTSLIINASPDHDKNTKEQLMLDSHINCVILHKKF
jgi:hypothetical protein